MGIAMGLDATVQFRVSSSVKEEAFAVLQEMGVSPSVAMQLFLQQIQKTKTLPFIITASSGNEEMEDGYDDWLRARLESTLHKLQSGDMKRYTHNEAMSLLDDMVESRVKSRTK
jgi:addiction module RelB/DinJ family antitoxin